MNPLQEPLTKKVISPREKGIRIPQDIVIRRISSYEMRILKILFIFSRKLATDSTNANSANKDKITPIIRVMPIRSLRVFILSVSLVV